MLKQVKRFNDKEPKNVMYNVTSISIEDAKNYKYLRRLRGPKGRARRQVGNAGRGRFRGQTQSQYLAIDRGSGKDDGKAEALSDADSSRASVSKYF